jgi:hypothetical protein
MPLIKSTSKQAFESNIARERAAGRPEKQALAIAYSERREAAKRPAARETARPHSRHIEELGSSYESNSVSSGQRPSYHPAVEAMMNPSEKD